MKLLATLSSAILLSGPSLLAQVSPEHFAVAEGNAGTRSPLATGVTTRSLQIHGDIARSRLPVRALAFRRDSIDRTTFSPFTVTLTLTMSTGATTVSAPSATFAANHGSDQLTVFARRPISFAASVPTNTLPAPFDYVIPFDQNFAYSPFGPTGPLVWDAVVEQASFGAERPLFDFVRLDSRASNPLVEGFGFGTGCIATGRTQPMRALFTSTAAWSVGRLTAQLGGAQGPANAAAVGVLGFSSTSVGGLPLPILLPGTAGAPSGPCTMLCDSLVNVPGVLDATGSANLLLQANIAPELHGLTFFHQLWALDPPANALGLVTSSASARQLVAPYTTVDCSRVEGIGQTGPTGIVTTNSGAVVRFVR